MIYNSVQLSCTAEPTNERLAERHICIDISTSRVHTLCSLLGLCPCFCTSHELWRQSSSASVHVWPWLQFEMFIHGNIFTVGPKCSFLSPYSEVIMHHYYVCRGTTCFEALSPLNLKWVFPDHSFHISAKTSSQPSPLLPPTHTHIHTDTHTQKTCRDADALIPDSFDASVPVWIYDSHSVCSQEFPMTAEWFSDLSALLFWMIFCLSDSLQH